MVVSASEGPVIGWRGAAAGSPRVCLPMPGHRNGPSPAGCMRRFHEGAHDQCEVGHHRLRHLDLARFRDNLSLLGVVPAFGRSFTLARRDGLGNIKSRGQRHPHRHRHPERHRLSERHGYRVGQPLTISVAVSVTSGGQPVSRRCPGHRRRGNRRAPGRPALRARRGGRTGRRGEPRLPPKGRQEPLIPAGWRLAAQRTRTLTYWTFIAAPGVVADVGEVQPHTPLGNEPPMATSRIRKNPWSTAACQVAVPTWLSVTVK